PIPAGTRSSLLREKGLPDARFCAHGHEFASTETADQAIQRVEIGVDTRAWILVELCKCPARRIEVGSSIFAHAFHTTSEVGEFLDRVVQQVLCGLGLLKRESLHTIGGIN